MLNEVKAIYSGVLRVFALCFAVMALPSTAFAAQTLNTTSTTSCTAQGGTLVGGNILTDFDNGTFGSEDGSPDQSPSTNPYPGQVSGGVFTNFYSFFHGAYGYVANPVNPRNSFQHPDITDPVYGTTGRFFASDPNVNTPIINFTALNVNPNENYQLSFWAANSEPNGTPNDINLEIDGIVSLNTGDLQAFTSALEWKKYAFVFNSGNRTEILIALRSLETGAGGRDFYLDNVEMEFCSLSGSDITGANFSDVDRDNLFQSARETGLPAINVDLFDTQGDGDPANDIYVSGTDSIANGGFSFINVPANPNYELRVSAADPDLPGGSSLGTASILSVNLPSSSNSTGNDFGFDLPRPSLTINKSSTVYDNGQFSGFSVPLQDIAYTISVENSGGEGADKDGLFVFDQLPGTLTFYNDDFDGAGVVTDDPIVFTQSSTGLDFDYSRDVAFSNDSSPPNSFSDCNYSPATGYDPDIRYVCLNPKGVMTGGSSPPGFTVQFRARVN